jgi:glycosidase
LSTTHQTRYFSFAHLPTNTNGRQHPWFQESRSSKCSPKRGWYIWKAPRFDEHGNRGPPNNWCRILDISQSAWQWDEASAEYYLSLFTPEQPDLNWEHDDLRSEVHGILRYWLDLGVDGFRMDVINLISKVQTFSDAEIIEKGHDFQPGEKFFANGPRLHEFLSGVRGVLDEYNTITVGEMPFVVDEEEIIRVVNQQNGSLNMIFLFDLLAMDISAGHWKWSIQPWDARDIKRIHSRLQRLMYERDGWNSVFCENHDAPRSVSRYTDDSDEWRVYGAKLLAMQHLTLGGTLYIHQGQELGMRNMPLTWGISEYKDVESLNYWEFMKKNYAGDPQMLQEARRMLQCRARDHGRLPMQWNASPHGGFCPPHVKPWMRVNDDHCDCNAENQVDDQTSVYSFWKKGLDLRSRHASVFVYGSFDLIDPDHRQIVAYSRTADRGDEKWICVLNFSGNSVRWRGMREEKVREWVMGNYSTETPVKHLTDTIDLRPWEGLIGVC